MSNRKKGLTPKKLLHKESDKLIHLRGPISGAGRAYIPFYLYLPHFAWMKPNKLLSSAEVVAILISEGEAV